MFNFEIKDIKKDLRGLKLQTIGGGLVVIGAITVLIGERISNKSVITQGYFNIDKEGKLIKDSVEFIF